MSTLAPLSPVSLQAERRSYRSMFSADRNNWEEVIARTVGEFFVDPIFAVPMGTENDAAAIGRPDWPTVFLRCVECQA